MNPIQTQYKGCLFRSRLEARWAVFFDDLGIEWQYEVEGFEKKISISNDEFGNVHEFETVRYLPDFYLPQSGTWVEVKGSLKQTDARKMGLMLDWGSPLPWFENSFNGASIRMASREGKKSPQWFSPGLLILGDVPHVEHGVVFHKMIRHQKGLVRQYAHFAGKHIFMLKGDGAEWINKFTGEDLSDEWFDGVDSLTCEEHFSPGSKFIKTHLANTKVLEAYKKARAARFEFGEVA